MSSFISASKYVDEKFTKDSILKKSNVDDLEQQFATISIIGPKLPQKHDNMMLMLRGNKSNTTEATSWINESMLNQNPDINMYNVEMYCWCFFPPSKEMMEDQDKHDQHLYELIRGYLIREQVNSINFETRKELNKNVSEEGVPEIKGEPTEEGVPEIKGEPTEEGVPETKGPIKSPFKKEGYRVLDQQYSVVAIVNNEDKSEVAIKIFAAKDKLQDAEDYAKRLQMLYPIFNIHVVDMYKWLLLPPDLSKIDNHNYLNKELDNLIKSNNQARESTQQMLASGLLDDTSVPVNFENVHPNLIKGVAEPKEPEVVDPAVDPVVDQPKEPEVVDPVVDQPKEPEAVDPVVDQPKEPEAVAPVVDQQN